MSTIGELLRTVRLRSGLDQADLARRAGTTQTYVSRVERGVTVPSLTTFERLCHAMGMRARLSVEPVSVGNVQAAELRRDFLASAPEQRIQDAMALSGFITELAAAASASRDGTR